MESKTLLTLVCVTFAFHLELWLIIYLFVYICVWISILFAVSCWRFLNRIAKHPDLRSDRNFIDFLEVDGDLPKSSTTSALSSAGLVRLFGKVGDSINKMTYTMSEPDQVLFVFSLRPSLFDFKIMTETSLYDLMTAITQHNKGFKQFRRLVVCLKTTSDFSWYSKEDDEQVLNAHNCCAPEN